MKRKITILIICFLITSLFSANVTSLINSSSQQFNSNDEYDMVIISPEIFSSSITPLIVHKNSIGINTFLKSTDEIYSEYDGRDKSEQIKYFIKDAIETYNIKYVLLMGGKSFLGLKWNLPARYVQLNDGFGYSEFLSDLYYADIYKDNGEFENWDSNKNGIFAEWGFSGDNLDLKPDIAVGRLPCRNINEVKTIVDKIINYEKNAYGKSWFKNMVVVGGDTFPTVEGYEGESTCDIASNYMDGFEITKLYTSTGALSSPDEIINSINQGCGFLLTRGRGGTDRVRMVMPNGSEFIALNLDSISDLNNKDMYPICVLGECIHGKFDVGIINVIKLLQNDPNYSINDCILECIAWRLMRNKNAGGIATFTNTNICYGAMGDTNNNGVNDDAEMYGGFLAVELFRLYSQEGIGSLGTLHKNAITNYIDIFPVNTNKIHCKSVQEFILFGDPSLKIGGYE